MVIIILASGYIIIAFILFVLLNDYLYKSYLKSLKKLIDYNENVMKELEKLNKEIGVKQ